MEEGSPRRAGKVIVFEGVEGEDEDDVVVVIVVVVACAGEWVLKILP